MKHVYYSFLLLLLLPTLAFGQHKMVAIEDADSKLIGTGYPSTYQLAELAGVIYPDMNTTKWATQVKNIEGSKHNSPTDRAQGQKVYNSSPAREAAGKTNTDPVISSNFEANWSVNSTPPDNTIAISNGGFIVSANNDGIEVYNESGALQYFDFWEDFVNDPALNSSLYDPKVIYDSQADRFVLILLHGSTSTTSKVLVCFSQSNNPTQGWWVYQLNGNVLNNNTWFDYPNVAVSDHDVFVTGNLYDNNDAFDQSIILQIPKAEGYAGQNINWVYWNNFGSTPFPAFTIMPAGYGHQGNYGPGIYLVSNRPGGSSSIRLYEITNRSNASPVINFYSANTTAYSPAIDSDQLGSSDKLDNRDNRLQHAFYLGGIIHFTFHSDIGQSWNGINYNRLNVSQVTNQSSTFGLQGTHDYSYPTVASISSTPSDKSVVIAFLRASATIYPEIRAVRCDDGLNWSNSVEVKAGETHVDFLQGTEERWGDYIGIARKYNATVPEVWLAGCYGANISGQRNNTYKAWIAQIKADGTSTSTEIPEEKIETKVFPNPIYDFLHVEFEATNREVISIELFNLDGKLIKHLYRDVPKQGTNRLSFNRAALSSGTYQLLIRNENEILHNEQVLVLD